MSIVPSDQDGRDHLVDRSAACVHLGISSSTLDRLLRDGALPTYRIGRLLRFRLSDLDAFIASARREVAR